MSDVIDFHTHAFPDALAEHAITTLEAECDNVTAVLDGRVQSLLDSMDRAGIARSVICCIATKPRQFAPILDWCEALRSERVEPFPSVHPRDPDGVSHVARIHERGFKGIKLHPYYQDFYLDEPCVFPLYEKMAELGLLLVCHTGFDIAFPRIRRCDPVRIANVVKQVPSLKLVATHLGAWDDWDEVRRWLLGRAIYMELSYSLHMMTREDARALILAHPADRMLFGTDSPWRDQLDCLKAVRALELPPERERALLSGNAARLLS